jgi:hypothetical protein
MTLKIFSKSMLQFLIRVFSQVQLWNPGTFTVALYEKITGYNKIDLVTEFKKKGFSKKSKYKKIIIGMYRANVSSNFLDLYIYQHLKREGIEVKVILCDGTAFPCDSISSDNNLFNYRCIQCKSTQKLFSQIIRRKDIISPKLEKQSEGVISLNAMASARRFDQVELNFEKKIASKYQKTYQSVKDLLKNEKDIDLIIMSHGLYATWGAMSDYCNENNIDYVTWGRTYFNKMISIVKNSTINEGISQQYLHEKISHDEEFNQLISCLELRINQQTNTNDSVNYYSYLKDHEVGAKPSIESLLSSKKRIIAIYLGIPWDGTVYGSNGDFTTQYDLIRYLVDIAKLNTENFYVFRVHPRDDELKEKASEQVRKLCQERFENILIIDAHSTFTSYDLMKVANLNLIYSGTLALEIAYAGLPLVVCGRNLTTGFASVKSISRKHELEEVLGSDFECYRPNSEDVSRSIYSLAKTLYLDDLSNTEKFEVVSFNKNSSLIERILKDLIYEAA